MRCVGISAVLLLITLGGCGDARPPSSSPPASTFLFGDIEYGVYGVDDVAWRLAGRDSLSDEFLGRRIAFAGSFYRVDNSGHCFSVTNHEKQFNPFSILSDIGQGGDPTRTFRTLAILVCFADPEALAVVTSQCEEVTPLVGEFGSTCLLAIMGAPRLVDSKNGDCPMDPAPFFDRCVMAERVLLIDAQSNAQRDAYIAGVVSVWETLSGLGDLRTIAGP